ncbi:MAG: hypothetical protein R3B57_13525 [Phycisphaerales bacterium]
MRWRFLNRRTFRAAGERFRLEHSRWLTHAVVSQRQYPRIPTRPATSGGFDRMMRLDHGPERASKWWSLASDRVDSLGG